MKKKIKDLTYNEALDICKRYFSCSRCPLHRKGESLSMFQSCLLYYVAGKDATTEETEKEVKI